MVGSSLDNRIIDLDRSVIPACDVSITDFEKLIKETAEIKLIGAYKIGFELGLGHSLKTVVDLARKYTDKPIIYDHQKAGTDIPDTGKNFARVCKEARVNAVIIFPQSGPETEKAWISHAMEAGLGVIIGGRMTHPAYTVSEGGFITDIGAMAIYRIAASKGVSNFVVPGNKVEVISEVKGVVESEGISKPVFYAPGFIAQGGEIASAAKAAGDYWHAIVGRGIYNSTDIKKSSLEYVSQL